MANNSAAFLTLPAEIRLRVYDLLLVSRSDSKEFHPGLVETPYLQRILVGYKFPPKYTEPGILQTCRQIYHEASKILYSQNIFSIDNPVVALGFIGLVGLANVKLMKALSLWVTPEAELAPWLELLSLLAKEATGLRYIEITWVSFCESPSSLLRGAKERGLGDNLDFVRALGKIKGLDNLSFRGCYAKNWPAYLERRMTIRVRAPSFKDLCLLSDDIDSADIEGGTREVMEYQEGTEDLIP